MLNRLTNIFKKSDQSQPEISNIFSEDVVSNAYGMVYIKEWVDDTVSSLRYCQGDSEKTIEIITKSGEDFINKFNNSERKDIFWYMLGELSRHGSL